MGKLEIKKIYKYALDSDFWILSPINNPMFP